MVIFVVIDDGAGSFKTVNLEVFKLKKEKSFFLFSIVGGEDRVLETETETRENEKEMKSKKKNKEKRNA